MLSCVQMPRLVSDWTAHAKHKLKRWTSVIVSSVKSVHPSLWCYSKHKKNKYHLQFDSSQHWAAGIFNMLTFSEANGSSQPLQNGEEKMRRGPFRQCLCEYYHLETSAIVPDFHSAGLVLLQCCEVESRAAGIWAEHSDLLWQKTCSSPQSPWQKNFGIRQCKTSENCQSSIKIVEWCIWQRCTENNTVFRRKGSFLCTQDMLTAVLREGARAAHKVPVKLL